MRNWLKTLGDGVIYTYIVIIEDDSRHLLRADSESELTPSDGEFATDSRSLHSLIHVCISRSQGGFIHTCCAHQNAKGGSVD